MFAHVFVVVIIIFTIITLGCYRVSSKVDHSEHFKLGLESFNLYIS